MTAERHDDQGVTWFRPLTRLRPHGVTWMFAAFAVASVLSTTLPTATAEPVGQVETSMVEMLATDSTTGVVRLAEVRNLLFPGSDDAGGGYVTSLALVDTSSEPVTGLTSDMVFTGYLGVGDGSGIDVALIDTGVAPVDGLTGDKVLHGPDLSFEGVNPESTYIDSYGHGTHMAGIIAGNRKGDRGVAPGARIVSVKVAGHDGITTVPQVIAAIDWVVEHRNSDGLNIRVLNLSLGQQGVTTHVGDPLSAAVERAWKAGIFVVVAAGNDGELFSRLDSPAIDPYVMAVGAADSMSSTRPSTMDVPSWSGVGDGQRNPDAVAAGRSIASYRVPGSTADLAVPSARVGDDLFKGSGTSQAAAAVSGAAAAILSSHPGLSNDDLKKTFTGTAVNLRFEQGVTAGKGLVDGAAARSKPKTDTQFFVPAAGIGTGILAPTGATWSGGTWSGATWSGATWSGATWSGGTWSGATWSGATWSGATWSGATWSGATWSGATWSGATWSGATWSGATWSATGWTD